jgi:SMI1 / KNR4 family (SUKH-1)
MSQSAVEKAIAGLTEAGLVNPGALKGCASEEIGKIEAEFCLQLPAPYKEFLARMGKAAGQFLVGSDWLFPAMLRLRDDAEALLEESEVAFRLDRSDFVFAGHQGYEFLFFSAADKPDPPVFLLAEDREPYQAFLRFSEWLLSAVSGEIEAFQSLGRAAPGSKRPLRD